MVCELCSGLEKKQNVGYRLSSVTTLLDLVRFGQQYMVQVLYFTLVLCSVIETYCGSYSPLVEFLWASVYWITKLDFSPQQPYQDLWPAHSTSIRSALVPSCMLIIFSRVSICHSSHLLLHSILISWLLPRWTNANISCDHSYSLFYTVFFIVFVLIVSHSTEKLQIFLKKLQFAWKIVSVKPNIIKIFVGNNTDNVCIEWSLSSLDLYLIFMTHIPIPDVSLNLHF